MKINIKRINYKGIESVDGDWWKYDELCDICHEKVKSPDMMHSKQPDLKEIDICGNCLHMLMEYKITYEDMKKTFEIEINGKNVEVFENLDGRFIKPGMYYVGKRNTGYELGKCFDVRDGFVVPDPPYSMYFYNEDECRVVKKVGNV